MGLEFAVMHPAEKKAPRIAIRGASEISTFSVQKLKRLVDVVLLPMQRRVGLDDDALFGPALEFFHQFGFASL